MLEFAFMGTEAVVCTQLSATLVSRPWGGGSSLVLLQVIWIKRLYLHIFLFYPLEPLGLIEKKPTCS